jgi:hypothetical protein
VLPAAARIASALALRFALPFGVAVLSLPFLAAGCVAQPDEAEAGTAVAPFDDEDALNFIVIGDWGRAGFFNQREVARQMAITADSIRSRFIISTGDNFYTTGVESTTDPKWERSFEDVYTQASLQTPWYVVLGNHDWQGSARAQINYSRRSRRWRLPDHYYALEFPVDDSTEVLLVFIDTTPLGDFEREDIYNETREWDREGQLRWIDSTLAASDAEWKIAVGHHPIIVGSARYRDNPHLLREVLPILERHNAQAYFAGHEHNLQHLRLPGRPLEHFVSGAGSLLRTPDPDENNVFAARTAGFMAVSLTAETMYIQMIDERGRVRHAANVPVRRPQAASSQEGTPATGEAFEADEPVPAEGEGPATDAPPSTEDNDGGTRSDTEGGGTSPPPSEPPATPPVAPGGD